MIRRLAIVALAIVAFGGTVSAYAWWDTLEVTQNEVLEIGEGTDLVVEVNTSAPVGKVLVPSGVVLGINDVNEIVLSYDLNLSKEAQSALTLNTSVSNVEIDGDDSSRLRQLGPHLQIGDSVRGAGCGRCHSRRHS